VKPTNAAVIVLREIFSLNRWVRGVADCLSAAGLDFSYSDLDLAEVRRHKYATTADQILSEVSVAMVWLQKRCPRTAIQLVGFCFGGRAALIAAMLPGTAASFDFYGAGSSRMSPGGGSPMLELLEQVQGRFT
jgi:carboxymethylenebutenolidase